MGATTSTGSILDSRGGSILASVEALAPGDYTYTVWLYGDYAFADTSSGAFVVEPVEVPVTPGWALGVLAAALALAGGCLRHPA